MVRMSHTPHLPSGLQHVDHTVVPFMCAYTSLLAVKVMDLDPGSARALGSAIGKVVSTNFATPVSLPLVPGYGMLVLQRATQLVTVLTDIASFGSGDWTSFPSPPLHLRVGETREFVADIVGATEGIVYLWTKDFDTVAEGDYPAINVTVQPGDTGTVVVQCAATHALGFATVVFSIVVEESESGSRTSSASSASSSGSLEGLPSAPTMGNQGPAWSIVGSGIGAGVVLLTSLTLFTVRVVRRRRVHSRRPGVSSLSIMAPRSHPGLDLMISIVTESGAGRLLPSRRLHSVASHASHIIFLHLLHKRTLLYACC
jgi:hypothetical protein